MVTSQNQESHVFRRGSVKPEYIIISSDGHTLCDDKEQLHEELDNKLSLHHNNIVIMTYEEYDRRLDEVV